MRHGGIQFIGRLETVKCMLVYSIFVTELLQLAVCGTYAGKALFVMCGKHQFQSRLSGLLDPGAVCTDIHALRNREYTGGNYTAISLYNTDTAGADLILFLHEAKGGNLHSRKTGRFKDGRILRNADRNTVNR